MKISLLIASLLACCSFCARAEAPRPNIILVLVDDMGWGDTSINASAARAEEADTPVIHTPILERIARQGSQLRRHYTAAPVCAPARASLFSGVHQGHAEVIRNNSFDAALENSHTLASVLRAAGYKTALIGKWGIGGGKESGGTPSTCPAWPTRRGFDFFFGYNNHLAGHRHYPKEESNADPETHRNAIWDGDKMITDDLDTCYSTDLFTARAKEWISEQQKQDAARPFFLALTLIAPHARLAVPSCPYPAEGLRWLGTPGHMINTAQGEWDSFIEPEYRDNKAWEAYANKRFGKGAPAALNSARRHATMITRIDQALGDLITHCEKLGIAENTFIVFTSDNGPHNEPGAVNPIAGHPAPAQNPAFFRSYGTFDGIKRDVWEGGMRVPCLVYAPGLVKPGTVSMQPSQFQDWMATFADLAGVPKPMRCDGVSLLPELQGRPSDDRGGVIYSEYAFSGRMVQYTDYASNKKGRPRGEQQMLIFRDGDRWLKAIRTGIRTGEEDFEIYDVDADSHEAQNLADRYRDKQGQLKAAACYQRRAYSYTRDPKAGARRNPCNGRRSYDAQAVPADKAQGTAHGLVMRRLQTSAPWVPDFDTLPGADRAERTTVAGLQGLELPAGSITELRGFIRVPQGTAAARFYLTLDKVPGSKAYIKLHNFCLIDADSNYTPGTVATESSSSNTEEAVPSSGTPGIPLKAGLHEFTMVIVQGPSAPGKALLQCGDERRTVPDEDFFTE